MNHQPYSDPGFNKLYNLLFADNPELFKNDDSNAPLYPWNILSAEYPDTNAVTEIAANASLESRARMLAYNMLKSTGNPVDKKEILGIIVEVSLAEGLDVVAAYKDGTARYINHAEKMIVWETATDQSQALIKNLFVEGLQVVKNIGAWNKDRLPAPAAGDVRISFLVADGLYFGQGPFDLLEKDKMGGPVIHAATKLMLFLIQQQQPENVVN